MLAQRQAKKWLNLPSQACAVWNRIVLMSYASWVPSNVPTWLIPGVWQSLMTKTSYTLVYFLLPILADYYTLIYSHCQSWWNQWVVVMAASHYHTQWKWWSGTLREICTRLWSHSFLSCVVWFGKLTQQWVSKCYSVEFSLQYHIFISFRLPPIFLRHVTNLSNGTTIMAAEIRRYREMIPFVHHKSTRKQVYDWSACGKASCLILTCIFSVTLQHISEEAIVGSVCIEKDVDGFHPMNIGALAMQGRTPLFVSCTPKGCIELLVRTGVVIKGKHAVVIGRSNIVGTPAALLLQVLD